MKKKKKNGDISTSEIQEVTKKICSVLYKCYSSNQRGLNVWQEYTLVWLCVCVCVAWWACYIVCGNLYVPMWPALNVHVFLCVSSCVGFVDQGRGENNTAVSSLCVLGLISAAMKDEALPTISSLFHLSLSVLFTLAHTLCNTDPHVYALKHLQCDADNPTSARELGYWKAWCLRK